MSYELQGKLIEKGDVQKISDKFSKREFVVETKSSNNGMDFVDYVRFQAGGKRVNIVDNIEVGSDITVKFNIKGNKWNNKDGKTLYFVNLDAWAIDGADTQTSMEHTTSTENITDEEPDDLPF